MKRKTQPVASVLTVVEPTIDPEIVEVVYAGNPAERHNTTWNNNRPSDANIVRHITLRAAELYEQEGAAARDAYLEASGTLLEALRQQKDLEQGLAA